MLDVKMLWLMGSCHYRVYAREKGRENGWKILVRSGQESDDQ